MKRKLTTIFCADVQGYSAMMARDEQETLTRLKRYRGVMNDLFDAHGGEKVNTWGDAVIAEFPSVVEAVRCSVNIQDAVNSENANLRPEERMQFRIGINLGDVMVDNGDLYGDGVNVASRLESLADPGGVMVSQSVYNLTSKQLAVGFDFVGSQKVKDLDEPIDCYRLSIGGDNHGPKVSVEQEESSPLHGRVDPPEPPRAMGRIERMMRGLTNSIDSFFQWFPRQPRLVKMATAMIGFFFAINLLFSGIASPWFIFPSFPFFLLILAKKK